MKITTATSNTNPNLFIYGGEGRGKTTLACKAPKPAGILLERGLPRGVSVDVIDDVDSRDGAFNALRDFYNDQCGYQSLIIDGVDVLEAHFAEYICAKNNWKNIEQPSFGKGWVALDEEWRRYNRALRAICDKGVTVVQTCHADIMRVDDPRAPSYTAYAPRLHKRARALVMDAADAVFFIAEDLRIITESGGFNERTRASAPDGRFLFTEGKPAFAAKNRFGMPAKILLPVDLDFAQLSQYWLQ
jgi:AAA domain